MTFSSCSNSPPPLDDIFQTMKHCFSETCCIALTLREKCCYLKGMARATAHLYGLSLQEEFVLVCRVLVHLEYVGLEEVGLYVQKKCDAEEHWLVLGEQAMLKHVKAR